MKNILLFAFVLISSLTFAQDKKSLEERAQAVYKATTNSSGDYAAVAEYTYPKVFDIVPKETLIEVMNSVLNSPEVKIQMLDIKPDFSYGAIKKIDDAYYCLIDHNLGMKMIFTQDIPSEQGEMIKEQIKAAMETENVVFNDDENSFTIKQKAQMLAISDSHTDYDWYFINLGDEGSEKFIGMLFNDKVREEVGF
ncbi:hypothetical protein GCM10007424_14050 [Flavobacterium suaedae]|uniref:DUF4252 domain-containing protein n=1 Tax=Flavobacterium suaedae TaxID=1767027 RepID=A0ABQ1JUK6_9FLAO|nr:hypothetical protein [Flavobacterium suaedae]GGB75305.1 hypothetical protein GCM10007424_14050 [Flavobacterium suaedae]